jgi:methionyl-tRNA formyltransferase
VLKLMFLGQRQIAWDAMMELAEPRNRAEFDFAVLVTDPATHARLERERPGIAPRFISNEKRNTAALIAAIHEHEIDLLVSVQHNWILSKEVIAAVKGRALNLHNARLPHYQGYNSITHAIVNGDQDFYSTIHWMEEEVDTGDIAFEEVTHIAPDETALSLHRKSIAAAGRAFKRLLEALRNGGTIPKRAPQVAQPQFFGKDSIKKILDITEHKDGEMIDRLARALFYPPYNIAYRVHEGRKTFVIPESGLADLLRIGFSAI